MSTHTLSDREAEMFASMPRPGEKVFSENIGADLIVNQRRVHEASGKREYVATSDGALMFEQWHVGAEPDPEELVYYERRGADGAVLAHGWIHGSTRQIVQVG